jgi:coproporphyrinogen III oxidase-like Fe-S oxidoreductase
MPPIEDMELLSPNMQAGETLMLGLRLRAGIPKERVEQLVEVKDGSWRRAVIEAYVKRDLLEWSPNLRLTSQGLLLADAVIGDLLMEESPMVDISN